MINRGLLYLVMASILMCAAVIIPAADLQAQHARSDQMITIAQFKKQLQEQGRDLSQATHEELEMIKAGGDITEQVIRIGRSTFIINFLAIYIIIGISSFTVLMFFTPIGLFLFRGALHAFVGGVLKATGISKRFGEHLMKEPKKWLNREKGIREAFALYMHNEFIPEYKNNITAIAFIGTAFLIANIGLRGVKFMVAHQPDFILIAIIVEITVLCLLGLTTWYEKEEEEEGVGAASGMTGKQLTLREVNEKIDALKQELETSVETEVGLRQ